MERGNLSPRELQVTWRLFEIMQAYDQEDGDKVECTICGNTFI